MIFSQKVFKLWSGHENVYGWTDGRQANRYIPRTFRSGDEKDCWLVVWGLAALLDSISKFYSLSSHKGRGREGGQGRKRIKRIDQ